MSVVLYASRRNERWNNSRKRRRTVNYANKHTVNNIYLATLSQLNFWKIKTNCKFTKYSYITWAFFKIEYDTFNLTWLEWLEWIVCFWFTVTPLVYVFLNFEYFTIYFIIYTKFHLKKCIYLWDDYWRANCVHIEFKRFDLRCFRLQDFPLALTHSRTTCFEEVADRMKLFFFRKSNVGYLGRTAAGTLGMKSRRNRSETSGTSGRRRRGWRSRRKWTERLHRCEEEHDEEEHDGTSDWKSSKTEGNAVAIPTWDERDCTVAGS